MSTATATPAADLSIGDTLDLTPLCDPGHTLTVVIERAVTNPPHDGFLSGRPSVSITYRHALVDGSTVDSAGQHVDTRTGVVTVPATQTFEVLT